MSARPPTIIDPIGAPVEASFAVVESSRALGDVVVVVVAGATGVADAVAAGLVPRVFEAVTLKL
jgi:hypothetical protein